MFLERDKGTLCQTAQEWRHISANIILLVFQFVICMNENKNSNPSFIARETLKQLALLKVSPTPDNYHKLYDQIAGNPPNQISAITAKMLIDLAKSCRVIHRNCLILPIIWNRPQMRRIGQNLNR